MLILLGALCAADDSGRLPPGVWAAGGLAIGAAAGLGFVRLRRHEPEARATAYLRRAMDAVADAVFVLDHRERVLFANAEAAALAGPPAAELVGREANACLPAGLADWLRRRGPAGQSVEVPGSEGRVYAARRVTWSAASGPPGAVVVVRDLTDQKRAQQAADRTTAYLRAALDRLADGVVVSDAAGNLLDLNPAAVRMHGYERVEQARRNLAALRDTFVLAPVGGPPLRFDEWPLSRLLRGEDVGVCELTVRRTDVPVERVVQYSGTRVPGPAGGTELVVVTSHDVTDRRRAEDELRASEQRFRAFADHAADAFFLHDDRGTVLDVNRQALASLGCERAELVGLSPLAFDPDLTPQQLANNSERLNAGETIACETRHRHTSGRVFPVELRIRPFTAGGRRLAVTLARDVTAQVAARAALRASEESYRLLFECNPLPMWVYHTETLAFLAVNPAAVAKYGYTADEFLAMTLRDIRPAEDAARLPGAVAAAGGKLSDSGVWRHRLKSGDLIQARIYSHPLEFRGRPARLVMAQDVTAQLAAEHALRESEEQLRRTLEASATGLWSWDLTGGTIAWQSDQVPASFHPGGAFDGTAHGVDRVLHPEDRERVWAAARRAVAARDLFECEFRVVFPNGGGRWVAARGRAAYADDGRPVRMLGTITDVTARKTAELELQRTRAVLQKLVDHSPALIFMTGADGRYLLFNPRCEAALGVRAADVLGRTPAEAFPAPLARKIAERDGHALSTGVPQVSEETVRTPDGPTHFSTVRFPVSGPDGRVIALGGVAIDITARRRAEDDLRAREELFRLLADESPHIIWVSDRDGRPEYTNARWREYSGRTADQAREQGWAGAVHPDDREHYRRSWREARARGGEHEAQVRLKRADGVYRWFLARAKPVGGPGGTRRWFGAATDIEEQKQREASLLRADVQKDAFLATLAHELRNPLAPIADVAHLLGSGGLDDGRLREAGALLAGQVRLLTRLVDDLTDLSRVRRGAVELRCEPVALADVIRTAVETSAPHIRAAGHRLSLERRSEPVIVRGDAVRLAQVVSNLLTNAAKYTPPGGNVWLALDRDGTEAVVRVRDDGAGIDPALLPRVFDMFVQERRLQEQAPGGLGVGLTLAQQIVELHGGAIDARSAGPGRGAEFVIRLPLAATNEPPPPGPQPAPAGPLRVLVVDDNEAVAQSFSWVLSGCGHTVAVAHDGPRALALVREFRPDAVLLDLGLPGTNGCGVAQAIRELPEGVGALLVAVTGWGTEDDRRQTRGAGFDHHLTKPVNHQELTALLATVSRQHGQAATVRNTSG
ncbi:Autoinducer 2 sensor kinase/phosphatase LuxQ [Gemmata obscuriglobus]|uniref:hybrid sensor histidine kinase/response regulator n=1 Tax=Gemmata obscuriglobus TaxID=114 RepID=UPI0011CCE4BE|nr:PAS domain S-box protein [Gemmata obscuriglobus]QEG29969.1 Autoinducer 2 sensor kinase/phosphatase LuxQ [Gemmata obscuriglobus]VTS09288.1 hybrid histidine kinase : Protein-glutamate methylesterase OS=Chondromyces apiculatus DSM 436 GN=CAP_4027 PE=4 SV=1: PAS_4: PAS_8: PAS_9: PAS_8: PAS_3: PAS_4: PAS_3: HisKA: HATPase_c: Response_reg [Gemmata obscuriglobus UQM 2246]